MNHGCLVCGTVHNQEMFNLSPSQVLSDMASTAFSDLSQNTVNVHENKNNNGNTLSTKPRNIAISAGLSGGSLAQTESGIAMKTRKEIFKNLTKVAGNNILVFDDSKVYSIAQEAVKEKELLGRVMYDESDVRENQVNTYKFTKELPEHSQSSGATAAATISKETIKIPALERGHLPLPENTAHLSQIDDPKSGGSGDNSLVVKLIPHVNAQTEKTFSALYSGDHFGHNAAMSSLLQNPVQENSEPSEQATIYKAKGIKVDESPKYALQHGTSQREKRVKNKKILRQKRKIKNRVNVNTKCQHPKKQCLKKCQKVHDLVASREHSELQVMNSDQTLALTGSCNKKTSTQKAHTARTISSRWASAIGVPEDKSVLNVNKIELPRRRDFPLKIRAVPRLDKEDDFYIPEVTRRLTVESPTTNLLVHTTYVRPNPFQPESGIDIEMTNHASKLYIGQKDDLINTEGTRRLICETECFASKDPKTKNLVIENSMPAVIQKKPEFVLQKVRKGNTACNIIVVEAKKPDNAGIEVVPNEKRCPPSSWCGSGSIRMFGNYIVIGAAKRVSSIVRMIRDNEMLPLTTEGDCFANAKPVKMTEAGNGSGDAVLPNMAINDCSVTESGDFFPVTKTSKNPNKNNNNRAFLQSERVNHDCMDILPDKVLFLYPASCYICNGTLRVIFCDNKADMVNDQSNICAIISLPDKKIILFDEVNPLVMKCMNLHTIISSHEYLKKHMHLSGIESLAKRTDLPPIVLESNTNNSSARESSAFSCKESDLVCVCYSQREKYNPQRMPPPAADETFSFLEVGKEHYDFFSQVQATDIKMTDEAQTGESLMMMPPGIPKRSLRNEEIKQQIGYRISPDYSVPRVCTVFGRVNFENQVTVHDICPSKEVQTSYPREVIGCIIQQEQVSEQSTQQDRKLSSCEFGMQVNVYDINTSTKTQTGSSLALNEPYVRMTKSNGTDHVYTGHCHEFSCDLDPCVYRDQGALQENETQVSVLDINVCEAAQTEDSLLLTKPIQCIKQEKREDISEDTDITLSNMSINSMAWKHKSVKAYLKHYEGVIQNATDGQMMYSSLHQPLRQGKESKQEDTRLDKLQKKMMEKWAENLTPESGRLHSGSHPSSHLHPAESQRDDQDLVQGLGWLSGQEVMTMDSARPTVTVGSHEEWSYHASSSLTRGLLLSSVDHEAGGFKVLPIGRESLIITKPGPTDASEMAFGDGYIVNESPNENNYDDAGKEGKEEKEQNWKAGEETKQRTHKPYKRRRKPNRGPSVSTQTKLAS